ncbi:hypothetical protein JCM16303_006891 [Sporobolomyces ruberrimus]
MTSSPVAMLPPELLLEIFSQSPDQEDLKRCTLVCQAWRDEAQSVLWRSGATLVGDEDIRRFVGTASRRRVNPKEMTICNLRNPRLLSTLWSSIAGVETLVILSEGGTFSAETFNHPALADLKTLSVKGSLAPSDPSLRLPFRLSLLNISDEGIQSRHLASFLGAIAQTSTSTLRSLCLLSVNAAANSAIARSILPLAPNLQHFGLSLTTERNATAYAPFLGSATSLRSIECTGLYFPLLHSLPPNLKGFALSDSIDRINVSELMNMLRRLKHLERLFFTCSREDLMECEGGPQMIEEMTRRKVAWYFSE